MVKKIVLFCLCVATFSLLWAEVSVLSVTDEDKHQTKEDFYHTYEYAVYSGSAKPAKCQATRIAPHWFATAAHCVEGICDTQCDIVMDLMDTSVSVLAKTSHDTNHATVFKHPNYTSTSFVNNDFALIKLDVRQAPKIYFRREKDGNKGIRAKEFFAWLNKNPRAKTKYNKAMNPSLPPLVDFSVSRNYELARQVSVISISGDKREVKKATKPVYYINTLGYAYTNNFGIQKGMSGSGVMSNTGELIGIITSSVSLYKKKGGKQQYDWFMFPVFNKPLISFMKDTMGSDFNKIDFKNAVPSFVKRTQHDFSLIQTVMLQEECSSKS